MVQADLIIPPIIVGLLIIMVFRVNAFIMETSADNRLNNDVQMFSEVAATVLQDELRTLHNFTQVHSDSIKFVRANSDTVSIQRVGRNIQIARYDFVNAEYDTLLVPANLTNLQFTLEPQDAAFPTFLRVRVETESQPEQHVRFRNQDQTVRAFAERRIFLRNVAIQATN